MNVLLKYESDVQKGKRLVSRDDDAPTDVTRERDRDRGKDRDRDRGRRDR